MQNLSIEAINELRRNARSVVRELGLLNDAYFEIGVTLAERHLLIELTTCSSPTMGEIADRLLLDKSTASRLISNAVKKGYVKCITDEKDKRKRFLQMTEKGKETLNAFEPIAFNQTKEALLTLTNKEIETIHKGVALYARGLKNSRVKCHVDNSGVDNLESLPEISQLLNLETAVQGDKVMQDFESGSFAMGVDHSQKVKATPIANDYGSKDCVNLSPSTAVSRLNQMGYTLELFDQKDEQGLYDIFREVVESGSQFPYESSSIEEFHRQFFTPQGQVYVCRSLDGDVIGGFYLRANFSGRSNHIANAAYMIRNTHRGKGIGSLLIKASLHFAKSLGFKAMQFNMVLSQNKLAVKLYEKLGFSIAGTIPQAVRNPDGSYQDGYVMHRALENL